MTTPQDEPRNPDWVTPGGPPQAPPAPGPGAAAPPPAWSPAPVPPAWSPAPVPPADGAVPPAAPGGSSWGAPAAPPSSWGAPAAPQGPTAWGVPPAPPPPGYASGPYGSPMPGVWRPPALQPGIIPLRPLGLGEILDGGVRAIRANPTVMFGLSAAVVTAAVTLSALVTWYLSGLLVGTFSGVFGSLEGADGQVLADLDRQLGGSVASLASTPITSVATTILTGLLVISVSRSVLGRTITVREVARSGRVWWVLGFTVGLVVVELVVVGAWVGLLIWLISQQMNGAAVAVGLIGGAAVIVGAFWLSVRVLLITPALMLEGKGFWTTVRRAWRLTRGSFWRLLGIYLLVSILTGILTQIVVTPFAIVAGIVGGTAGTTTGPALAITSVGQIIALTATITYSSAVVALLYIDVRMRREGLDVELGRAASAEQDVTA